MGHAPELVEWNVVEQRPGALRAASGRVRLMMLVDIFIQSLDCVNMATVSQSEHSSSNSDTITPVSLVPDISIDDGCFLFSAVVRQCISACLKYACGNDVLTFPASGHLGM